MFEIAKREMVVPNMHRMDIVAPLIASKVKPGQFVLIIPDENGERVPFTVSDWDVEKGIISVFFQEVGVSTMKMAAMKGGQFLYAVVGPLGKATEIDNFGTVLLGGGCYGIGSIYPIARAMKEAGNRVISVVEGRSLYVIYNIEQLKEVSHELIITTSDGSSGFQGKVYDAVEMLLERNEQIDRAHFIGCTFMMMISSDKTKDKGIKTVVTLNALMVDGTGMCGCCRVSVGGETKFVCVDGPEFDGHEVDWKELFQRNGIYISDESMAYMHFTCKQEKEGT
ncbi:MAG TPA: sulfide/dihydroorotate dehydrogenase-like FAD/NAD-binding protein [Euryarchaeota archaeon]|nr:sulfide/dihydroorotate dehydrogenase-like FAD/NAD-binding protein [Euryarchaeota archaeon]